MGREKYKGKELWGQKKIMPRVGVGGGGQDREHSQGGGRLERRAVDTDTTPR